MFCVPVWQTAGFTTVSSIESLQRSGQRDGDKRDNREKALDLHCRAVLRVL